MLDPSNSLVVCWNCLDLGHVFHMCLKNILHIFCHGCGTPNVYLPNCRTCRPISGNVQLGMRQTGRSFPPWSENHVPKTLNLLEWGDGTLGGTETSRDKNKEHETHIKVYLLDNNVNNTN